MARVVDGVEQLQAWFGQYLPQVAIAACAPFAIFAFMACWDVPVAAVMLAAALFSLTAPGVVHKRTGHASRQRMRAFKAFDQFAGGDIRPWLLTIVRNVAYRWLSVRKRTANVISIEDAFSARDDRPGYALEPHRLHWAG